MFSLKLLSAEIFHTHPLSFEMIHCIFLVFRFAESFFILALYLSRLFLSYNIVDICQVPHDNSRGKHEFLYI